MSDLELSRESSQAATDAVVKRCRDGDPRALAMLYRQFAPALLGYLQRLVGECSDAEDLLQEVFLRLLEGRGRYEGRGKFRQWLFTVATNLARDRLKQQQRRGVLNGELFREPGDIGSSDSDPIAELLHQELLVAIDSTLADLPTAYAEAFHLRVREQFTYNEMAAIGGESAGTLRSRVFHTLKRIRLALGARGYTYGQAKKEEPR